MILAWLSEDPGLTRAFTSGTDIHVQTASLLFGEAEENVTPEERRIGKTINFGVIYGMSAFGLAKQLHLGRNEAQQYIDRYFERFPGIRAYMDDTTAFAKEHGYVQTLFGRKINTPEIGAKGPTAGFAARADAGGMRVPDGSADVVLTDLVMPGLSGLDLLRTAASLGPATCRQALATSSRKRSGPMPPRRTSLPRRASCIASAVPQEPAPMTAICRAAVPISASPPLRPAAAQRPGATACTARRS